MRRKRMLMGFALIMVLAFTGCGKKDEPEKMPQEPVVVEPPLEEPEDTEDAVPEGMTRSLLTGEWIDEEVAAKRPYAVMIGNTSDALPQYGLSQADVIYEVPVEASYTRLMAIFQDISGLDKIGSLRSCRHYFIYFALEFDALYVHYGQAVYAEPILKQDNVQNLNGMDGSIESLAFYRDKSRKAPHNAFTSQEGLEAAAEKKGYRTEYQEDFEGHYQFAEDEEPVMLESGEDALVVSPGYFVNRPWFVYNEEEELYYRYEFKKEQVDAGLEEDQQLKVKNILVQYCNWNYADENGYLDIHTIPSNETGKGIYITNGKMIPITWTKKNENSPAKYFTEAGEELVINQGKTWVCVVRDNYQDRFHVYSTEEELQEARNAE